MRIASQNDKATPVYPDLMHAASRATVSDMADAIIEHAGLRFRLPYGDSVAVAGATVTLESRWAGGEYWLLGIEQSPLDETRVIHVGPLILGWWNAAPPGVACEYPFPE